MSQQIHVQIQGTSGEKIVKKYLSLRVDVPVPLGTVSGRSLYAFQVAWDALAAGVLGDRATRADVYEIYNAATGPQISRETNGYLGTIRRGAARPRRTW